MKMPPNYTPRSVAYNLGYLVGSFAVLATVIKFVWWIWSQPW